MRVLIVGSGGREDALCWKIAQSDKVDKVYAAPGNAGTLRHAENVPGGAEDVPALILWAKDNEIDLTVVGPEAPLANGLVDEFREAGLAVFGPTKRAAALESSKLFAKQLMRKNNIPTADFRSFSQPDEAKSYLRQSPGPWAIKADGLAAGKGVILSDEYTEAVKAIDSIMVKKSFGDSGRTVVIEEVLKGEEASLIAITDGSTIVPFLAAQDHKPALDGDKGPNTGGMGAYAPAPVVDNDVYRKIESRILVPTIHAMNKAERLFTGVLYIGLMISHGEPKVLEYNVRFGDPEIQPLLQLMKSDLADTLYLCARGKLDKASVDWHPGTSVCVVMASGGYPGSYEKGYEIDGIGDAESDEGVVVFHAGTKKVAGRIITSGGRVLSVTAMGKDVEDAYNKAYASVGKISFENVHYRKDIASKAVKRRKK